MAQTAPYGEWASPISSELLVRGSVRLFGLQTAGKDGSLFWTEMRPEDAGRYVVCKYDGHSKAVTDVTPAHNPKRKFTPTYSARTKVHEYGGGEFTVAADESIFFTNFEDQRLYMQRYAAESNLYSEPVALTTESDGELRYANMFVDVKNDRVLAVTEDHSAGDGKQSEAQNTISAISYAEASDKHKLPLPVCKGSDFYSMPVMRSDGVTFAFVGWDHPNMPWDNTTLYTVTCKNDNSFGQPVAVKGHFLDQDRKESIKDIKYGADNRLYFISDRSGFYELYCYDPKKHTEAKITSIGADLGGLGWQFGNTAYTFTDAHTVCYVHGGSVWLQDVRSPDAAPAEYKTPFSSMVNPCFLGEGVIGLMAGGTAQPTSIVKFHLADGSVDVIRSSANVDENIAKYFSEPEKVAFNTAYGVYYPPCNPDFQAPEGELPPLRVNTHGGPTSAASTAFRLDIQYWTSRGFAVLDVDYRGSSGYGRRFRRELYGNWGIYDVEDVCNGAQFLVDQKLADPQRLVIQGGSAGGYTVLAALVFRPEFFSAGASYYGVADLEALCSDTHKFESRYLDNLIGPYPEAKKLYKARSPVHFVDNLNCPLAIFQGLDDKIVLPNQAEAMYKAVKGKNLPVALQMFEGEAHGFRKSENIRAAIDGEFWFYSRVMGFSPADSAGSSLPIENM
jgi:dipeptidyl aminopeptidase/acylaminoacyl peptidase